VEERIIELESKVAFQDDTIGKLNDIITEHQREIYRLTRELEAIRTKLIALAPSLLANLDEEAPPPHY
jgi:SlyX protein